jgi:hypothetical protein
VARLHALGRAELALITCLLLLIATPARGSAREMSDSEAEIVRSFELAVRDYLDLRTAAIRSLSLVEGSDDDIPAMIRARADAVRAARQDARAGDVFSPAVGDLFKRHILAALREYGVTEDDVLRDRDEGFEAESMPLAVVNESFPWERAGRMLSCVLLALPDLPAGLEYRFVGTSLVLVDVEASLVVDVLPDALRKSLRT